MLMTSMNIDMSYFLKVHFKRCQRVVFLMKWNGEELVFNKAEAGITMKFTNQNNSSYCSEELKVLTQKPDFHQKTGKVEIKTSSLETTTGDSTFAIINLIISNNLNSIKIQKHII